MRPAYRIVYCNWWKRSALLLSLGLGSTGCPDTAQDRPDGAEDAANAPDSPSEGGSESTLGDGPSESDREASLEGGPDAPVDAIVPEGGDAGCSPAAVWHVGDDGFSYSSIGGFTEPFDGGCSPVAAAYEFSAASRTLSQHECLATGPVDRTAYLTDAQALQIVMNVSAIHTSCPPYSCGADLGDQRLTVRNSGSGSSTAYSGDFYAGCPAYMGGPLFISYSVLGDLESLLHGIAAASCGPEDAGGADGGTCVQGPADAGTTDGGGGG